jgi:hypothetical protein
MAERLRFHFDPVRPWCYQTSRWLRRVAALGHIRLSWGLCSLQAHALVEDTGSFGVPTVVLDGGAGRAFFGPVVVEPPIDDGAAVRLLHHVMGLTRNEAFVELKQPRDRLPDLASV